MLPSTPIVLGLNSFVILFTLADVMPFLQIMLLLISIILTAVKLVAAVSEMRKKRKL